MATIPISSLIQSSVSGYSGFSGVAGSSTYLNVSNDSTTSTSVYPVWVQSVGSNQIVKITSSGLYYVPSTGVLSATEFTSLSDETTKENIKPLTNSLEKVLLLDGVSFNWKDSGKESIGLLAQQVEKIIPEVVQTNEKGEKSVNYNALVGLLVEAIKELNEKIK